MLFVLFRRWSLTTFTTVGTIMSSFINFVTLMMFKTTLWFHSTWNRPLITYWCRCSLCQKCVFKRFTTHIMKLMSYCTLQAFAYCKIHSYLMVIFIARLMDFLWLTPSPSYSVIFDDFFSNQTYSTSYIYHFTPTISTLVSHYWIRIALIFLIFSLLWFL